MIGLLEAEAAFLGCLLQSAPIVTRGYLRQVEPEDMTDPRHEAVLRCMQSLRASGTPIDPVTVLGEMRRTGLQRAMTADRDAAVFLADLYGAPPSAGSIGYYLRVLLEHRVRRQVERTGTRLVQAAGSSAMDDLQVLVNVEGAELYRAFERLAALEQERAS